MKIFWHDTQLLFSDYKSISAQHLRAKSPNPQDTLSVLITVWWYVLDKTDLSAMAKVLYMCSVHMQQIR